MSKTFKLDTKGVQSEILKADYMASYIEKVARQQAGADTHVTPYIGFDRAKAFIHSNTEEHPQ